MLDAFSGCLSVETVVLSVMHDVLLEIHEQVRGENDERTGAAVVRLSDKIMLRTFTCRSSVVAKSAATFFELP